MTIQDFIGRVRRIQTIAVVSYGFNLEEGLTLLVKLGAAHKTWIGETGIVLEAESWLSRQLTDGAAAINVPLP